MKSRVATSLEVLTPLLAFEHVARGTGTIRKTCFFQNSTEQPLAVRIRYGFKEHSWLQLYVEQSDIAVEELVLDPGQTRIRIMLNTDSSNFPYDSFRGRVYFDEAAALPTPGNDSSRWLEISFEQIEDLRDFEGYAAVDLGTSNSMIALYHLRRDAIMSVPWNPVLDDGEAETPSAVFIKDLAEFRKLAVGACSVGANALSEYRTNPINDPRSLQLGIKRFVGMDRILGADAKGSGGYIDPQDVLYTLSRFLRERSQANDEVRARLRRLIVTFPPTWDYKQINRWKEVFHRLGFTDGDLDLSLDEASAAGLFHIFRWTKDEDSRRRLFQDLMRSRQDLEERGKRIGEQYLLNLLSFDFGGGTIDLALIRVTLRVQDDIIRMRITLSGSDSLGYGGNQVTLATFRILKRRIAMALSDPARLSGSQKSIPSPASESPNQGFFLLPSGSRYRPPSSGSDAGMEQIRERWEELASHITDELLPAELENAVDAVFPTRFWKSKDEPMSPVAKRNFGWLWEQAEDLKREIFREANRRREGISLTNEADHNIRGGIRLCDLPEGIVELPHGSGFSDARAWVSIQEIYRSIANPLETAVSRARQLADAQRVDRIVLTGQSSWIPLVRRLFMRPRSEGGLGLAPSKIEFDAENAKAAVSKGACLLRIMRDTLVGFEVDVSDFKANLLAEIFYKSPLGRRRTLFTPGPIDDLHYVEEALDPESFARYLSVFSCSPTELLGQFDFGSRGEELQDFKEHAKATSRLLALDEGFPSHSELLAKRDKNMQAYAEIVGAMRDWPERAIIAWMEQTAAPGSAERPICRYYLTKNRNLLAVRDQGAGQKRLFPLRVDETMRTRVRPEENPFSGIH